MQTQPDITTICADIQQRHRTRLFAMAQRKTLDLRLGSLLRRAHGWTKDTTPEAKRQSAAAIATTRALLDAGDVRAKGTPLDAEPPEMSAWADVIAASIAARRPFDQIESDALRDIRRFVRLLPIWARFKDVKGVAETTIGAIIGEAGDLSVYDRESKLWKRMGVGVMGPGDGIGDHAQGHPGPGADADDWIAEGYSKRRRSVLWNIGDAIVKVGGPYRAIYDNRKAYEIARAEDLGLKVAPAAQIPKGKAHEYRSAIHVHRRAQRYMEKRLLRHLWRAWRSGATDVASCTDLTRSAPDRLRDAA